MQPVICYVYEYDGDRRIRNAGFLKIQPKDPGVLLYFHIRSPLFRAQAPWNIYAFRSDGASCTLYPLLNVSVENQSFRMQLSLDSLRLTDQLTLDDMEGFWMSNTQSLMLAAAWKPTFVNSTCFSVYEETGESTDSAVSSDPIASSDSAASSDTEPEEVISEEATEEIPEEMSDTEPEETPETPSNAPISETSETTPTETTVIEAAEADEPICASETCTADPPECASECTPACVSDTSAAQPLSKNVRKICRKDLTLLPRRDWSLSNNSFLIHGCHNYHHLILAEEGHQLFLGVPGIYDQREARAAELFGFPLFSSEYVPFLDLTPEEKSENASFGHYLRKIRKN